MPHNVGKITTIVFNALSKDRVLLKDRQFLLIKVSVPEVYVQKLMKGR